MIHANRFVRAYEYLFYRAYLWPAFGSVVVRQFTAVMLLSVFLVWHVLTALAFFEGITQRSLIPGGLTATRALIFWTALIVMQYLWFVYSGRDRDIVNRYHQESLRQRRVRGALVCSYAALSFVLLISASVFRGHRLHL